MTDIPGEPDRLPAPSPADANHIGVAPALAYYAALSLLTLAMRDNPDPAAVRRRFAVLYAAHLGVAPDAR